MTYLPVSFLRPASHLTQPPAAPGLCVPCPVQGRRPHSVIVGGVSGPGVQSPRAEGDPKQRTLMVGSWVQPGGTRPAGKPRPLTPAVPGHLYCDPEPRKSPAPQAPDLATAWGARTSAGPPAAPRGEGTHRRQGWGCRRWESEVRGTSPSPQGGGCRGPGCSCVCLTASGQEAAAPGWGPGPQAGLQPRAVSPGLGLLARVRGPQPSQARPFPALTVGGVGLGYPLERPQRGRGLVGSQLPGLLNLETASRELEAPSAW